MSEDLLILEEFPLYYSPRGLSIRGQIPVNILFYLKNPDIISYECNRA